MPRRVWQVDSAWYQADIDELNGAMNGAVTRRGRMA